VTRIACIDSSFSSVMRFLMTAQLKRREMVTAHVHLVSRTSSAESLMVVANNTPLAHRDPVGRRVRNCIIAGNAIVWVAIIAALIGAFSF
jgi:hypothetical protein